MIINLKNNKNLSTNDLRNSCQVQWWYIHEFYTDSLSFSVLSLVNSSLEQNYRDNIKTGINMPRIDTYFLDKVSNGLKLELNELPFQYSRSNYSSSSKVNEVISAEIMKLIKK